MSKQRHASQRRRCDAKEFAPAFIGPVVVPLTLRHRTGTCDRRPTLRHHRPCCAALAPVVILPGLANAASDYKELEEKLLALGHSRVTTVPIARWQWLLNARGFLTPAYWASNLHPRPLLDWYFEAVRTAVDSVLEPGESESNRAADSVLDNSGHNNGNDARMVNFVGHSAGGWLARVYLTECDPHLTINSLVTLGTPHLAPPPGVVDQTRGLLTHVARKCDLRDRVSRFVCVAGGGTPGCAFGQGPLAQFVAYLSYAAVCGRGDVDGDGVTPVVAAYADGAEHVLCQCDHSMLTSETWYGAGDVVPQWAHYLA